MLDRPIQEHLNKPLAGLSELHSSFIDYYYVFFFPNMDFNLEARPPLSFSSLERVAAAPVSTGAFCIAAANA